MFREIRTSERISEQVRKMKEEEEKLENIRRICEGQTYSKAELEEAKRFVESLFIQNTKG